MDSSLVAAFGLGLLLGIQHALDPDHLIAVSTIVSEHKNFKWASLIGAFWCLGHTTTLFLVGLLVIGLRVTRDRDQNWRAGGVAVFVASITQSRLTSWILR